jgi:integrase
MEGVFMINGCRPLTDVEIVQIYDSLPSLKYQALFMVGLKTGFRISELLSLKVSSVMQHGAMSNVIVVERKNMKGKKSGRTVPMHPEVAKLLQKYIEDSRLIPDDVLFDISRQAVDKVLKLVKSKLRLQGKVAAHSFRKTFATKVYDALGHDLVKTQKAMDHSSINSTVKYLSFRQEEIDAAILSV